MLQNDNTVIVPHLIHFRILPQYENQIRFRRDIIEIIDIHDMKNNSIICSAMAVGLSAALVAGCATQSEKGEKSDATEKKSTALTASQLPAPVLQEFQAKFPAAGPAEWKIKADKNYEAEFTLEKTEIAAKFDPAGKWMETERAIPPSELPPAVRNTAEQRYQGYTITETQTLQAWDAKSVAYELHLKNAKQTVKAVFSTGGGFLSESSKAEAGQTK